MAGFENLTDEEIAELLKKERLKHAVDRVLETQEILSRQKSENNDRWETAKARVTFSYYMNILGTLLKEREVELGEELAIVSPMRVE